MKNPASDGLLIGIDVGTTMIKATVVGLDGQEITWGRSPTPWIPVPTGSELEPMGLLGAVVEASHAALGAAPPGQVVGVGVTSIAETPILLGDTGRPMRTSIAWYDKRGDEEVADLVKTFGGQAFSERTGLPASTFCSVVKLAWLRRHHGPVVPRALSVADWVVHALGGDQVAEASLASRTGALSLAGRQWWKEILEWAALPPDLFPPVVQAGHLAGRVTTDALRLLPMAPEHRVTLDRLKGAALTSAGHDHLCAAAGAGAVGPAQLFDSCGTAEAFVVAVPPLDGAVLGRAVAAGLNAGWHTVPGRYALLVGQALGLTFEAVLHLLGSGTPDGLSALDGAAMGLSPGPLRVVREGPYASPSIVGIDAAASPASLWSATLDAVTREALQPIQEVLAVAGPLEELVLSGGWANCDGLRQRRRDLMPRFRWPAVTEAGARGAALFGGCAAGVFAGPADFPTPPDRPLNLGGPERQRVPRSRR